jgi:pimeloyl-ACP methyl ester carboxylesterase
MADQAYVHWRKPSGVCRPYPIVMVHGGGQTGLNFEGTPDGRQGWMEYFVHSGFAVYVMDQPASGRSPYQPEVQGPLMALGMPHCQRRLTSPEQFEQRPTAHLHTQWPGTGLPGDPIFDQFIASQVSSLADRRLSEELGRRAGACLLDRIGPAVLLTHSQSGAIGWQIADARPGLVKGIIALEPFGPPFYDVIEVGPRELQIYGGLTRPFGITTQPLTYAPGLSPSATGIEHQPAEIPRASPTNVCYLQQEPARQLSNLSGVPVLVITAEASYHSSYDHCTVKFLEQAGVGVDHWRLEDFGIRGNGHMMMLEMNSLDVAALLRRWLVTTSLA